MGLSKNMLGQQFHAIVSMQGQIATSLLLPPPFPAWSPRRVHRLAVSSALATDVKREQQAGASPTDRSDRVVVSICTNKTCKKQGSQQVLPLQIALSFAFAPPPAVRSITLGPHASFSTRLVCILVRLLVAQHGEARAACVLQILKFAEDLHLDGVEVRAVGCMAGCGHGPNVALDPPGVVLNHMATPARFRDAMSAVGGVDIPPKALKATELRLAGNANARQGDLQAGGGELHRGEPDRPCCLCGTPALSAVQWWTCKDSS